MSYQHSPKGKIFLIGAGPGDPDLLTIRAVKALSICDVVLYDFLVGDEILGHCKPGAEKIFVGKHKGNHSLPQDDINSLIAHSAMKGKIVGRLKGGDPMIFGRGGEEYEALMGLGLDCEIIPGITAALGAAAALALPLTHREYASEVTLITGHRQKNGDYSRFRSLDFTQRTYVVYMGLTIIDELVREICRKNPNGASVPAAIIKDATLPTQEVYTAWVGKLPELAKEHNIQSPALIVIGNVVQFLEKYGKLDIAGGKCISYGRVGDEPNSYTH
ncbi:MAG: uroporphyrinogen-III C-methyltransferase [Deltaproteobacteria bacterium]|nr:uroporphyrinogen-III C-methyltransferase [Deltaproteobacteria bacterium]